MPPLPQLPAPLYALWRRDASLLEPAAILSARLVWVEHLIALAAGVLAAWCRGAGERVLPASYGAMSIGHWVAWADTAARRLLKSDFAPAVAGAWLSHPLDPDVVVAVDTIRAWLRSQHATSPGRGDGVVTASAVANIFATLRNRTRGHGDPVGAAPVLVPAIDVVWPALAAALAPLWRGGLLRVDAVEGADENALIIRGIDLSTPVPTQVRTALQLGATTPTSSELLLRLADSPPNIGPMSARAISLRPWLLASIGGPPERGEDEVIHVYSGLHGRGARYLDTVGGSRVDEMLGREVRGLAELGLDERERLLAGLETLPWAARRRVSEFLDAYLGLADEPNPFCGRDEDVDRLRAFVDREEPPRQLLVTAPLGAGKSALLVRVAADLAGRDDIATLFVPVSLRFDVSEEQRVLQVLLARLARLHGRKPLEWERVSVAELRRAARELLDLPLPDGRCLILLLDGVDEATGFHIDSDIVPRGAPKHLRVIVSARSRPDENDSIEHARALGWDAPGIADRMRLPPLAASDVEAALRRHEVSIARLADHPEAVRELTRLVDGDPLTLWMLLRELAADHSARDIGDCVTWLRVRQPGLKGWFKSYWEDQHRQWGDNSPLRERAVNALLAILAVADVALGREELAAIAAGEIADGFAFAAALDALARLVHRGSFDGGYVMAHVGLALYLRDHILSPAERDGWRTRIAEYVRGTIADVAAGGRAPDATPRSVRRAAAASLRQAAAKPPEWVALASRAWCDAQAPAGAGFGAFLADVCEAEAALAAHDDRVLSRGAAPDAFPHIVRCALARASIGSIGALSKELLGFALDEGVWSPEEALIYAVSAPLESGEHGRANLLAALVPRLPMPLRPRLVDALREIGHNPWGGTLQVLDALDQHGGIEPIGDWMAAIRCDPYASNRATFLARAAGRVAPAHRRLLLDESLRIVRNEIPDPATRSGALEEIVRRLEGQERLLVLHEALAAIREIPIDKPRDRAHRIAELFPLVPEELIPTFLDEMEAALARSEPEDALWQINQFLEHVPPTASDRLVGFAEALCRSIADLERRLVVWGRFAHRLPLVTQEALRDEIIEAVACEPDESRRFEHFRRLSEAEDRVSPRPAAPLPVPVERLVTIARSFTVEGLRRAALSLVAAALDPAEIRALAAAALDENPLSAQHELHRVLRHLNVDDALALARRPEPTRPILRFELLRAVLARGLRSDASALVHEALAHAREIRTDEVRARHLLDLFFASPPQCRVEVFNELFASVEAIPIPRNKRFELSHLAGLCSSPLHDALIAAAADLARGEETAWHRIFSLHWILMSAKGDARNAILRSMAEEARRVPAGHLRATAFLFVARDAVPGSSLRREAITETLAARRFIGDEQSRFTVMAALLSYLPRAGADRLADEIGRIAEADHRFTAAMQFATADPRVASRCWAICRDAVPDVPTGRPYLARCAWLAGLLNSPGAPEAPEQRVLLADAVLDQAAAELDRVEPTPDAAWDEDSSSYNRTDARLEAERDVGGVLERIAGELSASQRARAFAMTRCLGSAIVRARALSALARPMDEDARTSIADEILALQPSAADRAVHHYQEEPIRRELTIDAAALLSPERREALLSPLANSGEGFARLSTRDVPLPIRLALIDDWLIANDETRLPAAGLVNVIAVLPVAERIEAVLHIRKHLDKHSLDYRPALRFHLLRIVPDERQDEALGALEAAWGDGTALAATLQVAAPRLSIALLDRALERLGEITRRGGSSSGDQRIPAFVIVARERLLRPSPLRAEMWKVVRTIIGVHSATRRDLLPTLAALAPLVGDLGGTFVAVGVVSALRGVGTDWP